MITDHVRRRLDSLTKPPGSLGRIEELLISYSEIRGEEPPRDPRMAAFVFCADHGVTAEGVSAWPQSVTREMVRNFVNGGAAISVLCRSFGIDAHIIDVGVAGDPVEGARDCRVAAGTRNFAIEPAMTPAEARAAMKVGHRMVMESTGRYDVLIAGEMGIGNTTAATALLCAYTGADPSPVTGPGAGLDSAGVAGKAAVIRRALRRHSTLDPMEIAACFGGFEILAIAGMLRQAAESRIPVILDGFISCAAALIVRAIDPTALRAAWFAHRSAEPGHAAMLEALDARPILDLEMRLGEGSGAALAAGLFRTACSLYWTMATFDGAAVSGKL